MPDLQNTLDRILRAAPVIPVYSPASANVAVATARALVAGGLPVIEVTLRSSESLGALEAIAMQVPDAIVGAGTVLSPLQARAACEAGARFLVSPGATDELLSAAPTLPSPLLPGVATASDIMRGLAAGLTRFKFFPATAAGGVNLLRAFAGPFPQVRFCPTGGITPETARDYLSLPNVICIGSSWLTPADAIAARDWPRIEALARAASSIV